MFRENRGLYIAGVFFVVVALGFILLDKGGKVSSTPAATPTPVPSPVLGLSAGQVQQVVVRAKEKVLTLGHQATAFTYSLCPAGQGDCPAQAADSAVTAQFFQQLSALRPTRVIFGAPEGLPAYGVDKPTTAEIDVKGVANQQATILVGSKSPDSSSYFARRQDSNDVLAIPVGSIDGLLALLTTPPVPQPTPSPAAPSSSPSAAVPPPGPPAPSP